MKIFVYPTFLRRAVEASSSITITDLINSLLRENEVKELDNISRTDLQSLVSLHEGVRRMFDLPGNPFIIGKLYKYIDHNGIMSETVTSCDEDDLVIETYRVEDVFVIELSDLTADSINGTPSKELANSLAVKFIDGILDSFNEHNVAKTTFFKHLVYNV